jgi:hypothetical protein
MATGKIPAKPKYVFGGTEFTKSAWNGAKALICSPVAPQQVRQRLGVARCWQWGHAAVPHLLSACLAWVPQSGRSIHILHGKVIYRRP